MEYQKILAFARILRKNQTKAEKFFWDKVRNRKLFGFKFRRQHIIQHANTQGNKSFFITDFYCDEKRLIIEIDGEIHLQQKEYDEIREEILREMGYNVIRFENDQVLKNWESVEVMLRSAISTSPPTPLLPGEGSTTPEY